MQQEALPVLKPDDVLVRATHGAVSRGTESLVLAGRVPASEHARMRCPHMGGSFEFPAQAAPHFWCRPLPRGALGVLC